MEAENMLYEDAYLILRFGILFTFDLGGADLI